MKRRFYPPIEIILVSFGFRLSSHALPFSSCSFSMVTSIIEKSPFCCCTISRHKLWKVQSICDDKRWICVYIHWCLAQSHHAINIESCPFGKWLFLFLVAVCVNHYPHYFSSLIFPLHSHHHQGICYSFYGGNYRNCIYTRFETYCAWKGKISTPTQSFIH